MLDLAQGDGHAQIDARSESREPVMKHPFSVPARLTPDLARVEAYWRGLLRGAATMPFWDDARLGDLPDMTPRLLLIDVFQGPERYRFNEVGEQIGGGELEGRFLDETKLDRPLEFLRAQCSVTIESAAPTWFRMDDSTDGQGYARLLLPMWGDGRASMILGAVEFE